MVERTTVLVWALVLCVIGQETGTVEQRPDGLWYLPGAQAPYTGKSEKQHFDGTKISEIHFQDGQLHGSSRFWYIDGKPRSSFNYHEGQLDGNATYYYRNGNPQTLTTYRLGIKHGVAIDWWPEGKKSFEETYNAGFPDGTWQSWWPNGKLASQKIYQERRLVSHREWSRNGMPKQLPGWNLDGSFKSAAAIRAQQQVIGRRLLWNRFTGTNRIDLIYRDKPLQTIRAVFGDPDDTDDDRWIYKGLRIQDPGNGNLFDTAIFGFKKGRVAEIWIE